MHLHWQNIASHVLFDLILYVPVNSFSVMSGRVFLGLPPPPPRLRYIFPYQHASHEERGGSVPGCSPKFPNIYVSWSTSELRVRLAPLNRFKPSSKIFYWPFQGGTSFVDLLCFCSVLCLLCFVHVCLYVLCGHLLGKGWPLGSRLWCLLWVCHFPIGILGQVWYLIVSIPDLCTITYF